MYDRGVHGHTAFLVMEKVEGVTLAEHVRSEDPISVARALEVAGGIWAALVAAHRAHVIHYDIKPHNVMLTPDGQVKVVDFGIAGFIQATFSVARSSQLTPAGTPEYGAPEQFLTERGDERSDLYALGGVLFALLAGRSPFTGHNAIAVIRCKLDEEAPAVESLRTDLPPAVAQLVAELLQRDPERRPQTAEQVQARLWQLRAALPPDNTITSCPPGEQPPPDGGTDDGEQHPPPDASFTISWTGKEPVETYAVSATRFMVRMATVALVLAPPGVVVPLALHRIEIGGGEQDNPWMAWFALSSVAGATALLLLLTLPVLIVMHRMPRGWDLAIGPQGIQTTSALGTREYRWDQVQDFTIEEIRHSGLGLYTYSGLHARETRYQPRTRPSGWPPCHPGTFTDGDRTDGRAPICILGPMTDEQRSALVETLARHGHQLAET
ncbi:serine/threonine-protein kinase [Kitasatospora aureofaciens]|uniref:serine/threonine-protein kinase n=1 Tax=Kitasatospora aureofaciens TaxID=1894 RepID=UPI0033EBAB1A